MLKPAHRPFSRCCLGSRSCTAPCAAAGVRAQVSWRGPFAKEPTVPCSRCRWSGWCRTAVTTVTPPHHHHPHPHHHPQLVVAVVTHILLVTSSSSSSPKTASCRPSYAPSLEPRRVRMLMRHGPWCRSIGRHLVVGMSHVTRVARAARRCGPVSSGTDTRTAGCAGARTCCVRASAASLRVVCIIQ